jgi:hypothetical protein
MNTRWDSAGCGESESCDWEVRDYDLTPYSELSERPGQNKPDTQNGFEMENISAA